MILTYTIADADWQRIIAAVTSTQAPPSGLGATKPDDFTRQWIIENALTLTKQTERQISTRAALAAVAAPAGIVVT